MRLIAVLMCMFAFTSQVLAGGRGGYNTTFDPNLFGGNWTTINCNNTSADETAWNNWKAAAVAVNPTQAKLRVTGICAISSPRLIESAGTVIQNAIIWGYGASVPQAYFGSVDFVDDAAHTGFIQTVSSGATNVTLVTAGDFSKFSLGDYICIAGLSLQQSPSFPPNFAVFEFGVITAIDGASGAITLGGPLTNSYRSTWPAIDSLRGPAAIYKLDPSWNTNYQIYGLAVLGGGSVGTKGRVQYFNGAIFRNLTLAPTVALQSTFINVDTGPVLIEADKEIDLLYFQRLFGRLEFQSSSINRLTIDNSVLISDGSSITLLGTPRNTTIRNTSVTLMRVGPVAYGAGNVLLVDGSAIGSAQGSGIFVNISDLSFSSGTLSILKSNPNVGDAIRWAVPGQVYYFGNVSGGNNSVPYTQFTITNVREDVTHYFYDTDIAGSFPGPNCSVAPCVTLVSYQQNSVKQINSPVGSASLSGFSPP